MNQANYLALNVLKSKNFDDSLLNHQNKRTLNVLLIQASGFWQPLVCW